MATLTKDDVKAIKEAQTFIVYLRRDEGTFTLKKRVSKKNELFTVEEDYARYEMKLEDDQITLPRDENRATFVSLYADGAWDALKRLVRVGDRLIFRARENGNGYLNAAIIPAGALKEDFHHGGYDRLFVDELSVSIVRNGRMIVREMVVESSICPDNTARAFRR